MNHPNQFVNRDFKTLHTDNVRKDWRPRQFHAFLIGLLISSVLIILFWPTTDAEANRPPAPAEANRPPAPSTLALPEPTETISKVINQEPLLLPKDERVVESAPPVPVIEPEIDWQSVTVKSGDTLSAIFDRQKVSPQQLHAVLASGEDARKLRHIVPGQSIDFDVQEGALQQLRMTLSPERTLHIERDGENNFVSRIEQKPVETRHRMVGGTIDSSLFLAGKKAQLSDRMIMELAAIFGWDIDFALDIRQGDRFSMIYEERYVDGEKFEEGNIVAAEFINQGRSVRAVRFTDPEGDSSYYSPEGYSMRKAFLRSPVDFRRISSKFQRERYHPVLGKKRPHRGVDYAASIGTPIKSAGDGKIIYRGWKGGYGRTVIIQHGTRYTTLYAHLSNYKRGQSVGSRVKQGEVVGFVGKSGLATGPHLHYEFRVDGVHRNPLTVKLPDAAPIPAKYKETFQAAASGLLAQLDVYQRNQIALNQ